MIGKSSQYCLQGKSIMTGSAFRIRLAKEHPGAGNLSVKQVGLPVIPAITDLRRRISVN